MIILITGATGFLGRNLVKKLSENKKNVIVGTFNSEYRYIQTLKTVDKDLENVHFEFLNLSGKNLDKNFEKILKKYKITHIIHCAAMKYVNLCENNKEIAHEVNYEGSKILIDIAKKNSIKYFISVSTDKAKNPKNFYGITKKKMEDYTLENGYSIFRGVNFFWSDGSVLDKWYTDFKYNKPLSITCVSHSRYFNTIDEVCDIILLNIEKKNSIILPNEVYLIDLKTLYDAFSDFFNYKKHIVICPLDIEKHIEEIDEVIKYKKINKDGAIDLVKNYFCNYIYHETNNSESIKKTEKKN